MIPPQLSTREQFFLQVKLFLDGSSASWSQETWKTLLGLLGIPNRGSVAWAATLFVYWVYPTEDWLHGLPPSLPKCQNILPHVRWCYHKIDNWPLAIRGLRQVCIQARCLIFSICDLHISLLHLTNQVQILGDFHPIAPEHQVSLLFPKWAQKHPSGISDSAKVNLLSTCPILSKKTE